MPVARLETSHEGVAGSLNPLVKTMHFVVEFGVANGIDPGRRNVSELGRCTHHMNDVPPGL